MGKESQMVIAENVGELILLTNKKCGIKFLVYSQEEADKYIASYSDYTYTCEEISAYRIEEAK